MSLNKIQITELFMKRFNCAAHKILCNNRLLTCDVTSNYSLPGLIYVKAPIYPSWILDRKGAIHPFSIMLAGRRSRTAVPIIDLEAYTMVPGGLATFRQGFVNASRNKDCWQNIDAPPLPESNISHYHSLYFNLGRAFLNKFIGIYLPHTLPITYQKLFAELQ
jgi:hypothetical protein